jgi:hypothetical protein
MKIAYIAHPVGGDVEGNLKKIAAIVKKINLEEPDTVPFVPYYVDCVALDDTELVERTKGIKNGLEMFKRGFIDELRLYGDSISLGMFGEIYKAFEHGVKVSPKTVGTTIAIAEKCGSSVNFFAQWLENVGANLKKKNPATPEEGLNI